MEYLKNLRELKDDMLKKGWSICDFLFHYKSVEYIVLVKRFIEGEKRDNKYALVKLHFMKNSDLFDDLQVEANIVGLLINAKELRKYFGIEYNNNLKNILDQFNEHLGKFIPTEMPNPKRLNDLEKSAIVKSLSESDSEDPRKKYCIGVKRNPQGQKRSHYNSEKTRLLREYLYNIFANDESISFCYSKDIAKENDDATILKNFAKEHKI